MKKNIVCDIGNKISFIINGKTQPAEIEDLLNPDNLENIFRIQFSKTPPPAYFSSVLRLIESKPSIELRFFGDYSEDKIDWEALYAVTNLQIDLLNTIDLRAISELKNLKRLGITKNLKSTVSLSILEPLTKLESLFTSISNDMEAIGNIPSLRFLSLRDTNCDNFNFLNSLSNLEELWLSLGSYSNFDGIASLKNLKQLSLQQVKGFNNEIANSIITRCDSLTALKLQDLTQVTSLGFLGGLPSLSYLRLDGLKNIESYKSLTKANSLETLSTTNSRPRDRDLSYLSSIKNVWLGDTYSANEIEKFQENFSGETLWIKGKDIKGKMEPFNPFDLTKRR